MDRFTQGRTDDDQRADGGSAVECRESGNQPRSPSLAGCYRGAAGGLA